MKHKAWRKRAAVAAVSLLFGTAAHAVVYPASFDPGGNGFDIPGFNGDALFDIPDTCLGDGWKPTGGSGGCGAASMVSAITYLYTTSPSPPVPGTALDQFILGSFPVLGVLAAGGQPTGVDTNPNPMDGVRGGDFYSDRLFWLQFVSGFCPDDICRPVPPMRVPPGGGGDILTSAKAPGTDPAYIFVNDLFNPSFPATVVFGPACPNQTDLTNCVVVSQVPEPGILGLILAALGGGWLARRRKRPA